MAESGTDKQKGGFRAFWSTLPGILAAIAALITAVAGILALFVVPDAGSSGDDNKHAHWVNEADRLCSETADTLRSSLISFREPETIYVELPRATDELRRMAERIRGLEAAEDDEGEVAHLTGLIDEQANEFDTVVTLYIPNEPAAAERQAEIATSTNPEISAAAESLESSACAQIANPQGF